jgi:release factor glutamine methyltransferase
VAARLRAAGCVYAEDEARLLVEATRNESELERAVRRRERGEPLEVIVGWAEFCGLRIGVDAGVFVPRQRTALLVDVAVAGLPADRPGLTLDLCCGSGALGLAVAARASIDLIAAELDPGAVACASRNLKGVGEVFAGDLFEAVPIRYRGLIDVILANAPYVPTADIDLMPPEARLHEPRTALDGGADGLDLHRRIITGAASWLAPGGRLLIEVAERQVPAATDLMIAGRLRPEVHRDSARDALVVVGRHGRGLPPRTPARCI